MSRIAEDYFQIQESHPNKIILFQIGTFYEIIGKNVKKMAELLNIKQTSIGKDENAHPMCGFPIFGAKEYIRKLIEHGHSILIIKEDEKIIKKTKEPQKRFLSSTITPSMVHLYNEYSFIDKSSYIGAIMEKNNFITAVFFDPSTGECFAENIMNETEKLLSKLFLYNVSELITEKTYDIKIPDFSKIEVIKKEEIENPQEIINFRIKKENIIKTNTMTAQEQSLLAKILQYMDDINPNINSEISSFDRRYLQSSIKISYETLVNLSIISNKKHSNETLLNIIDHTKTPMGKRLLYNNITSPSLNAYEIDKRLDTIDFIKQSEEAFLEIEKNLSHVYDIDRIIFRIINNLHTRDDLLKLAKSLHYANTLFSKIYNISEINKIISINLKKVHYLCHQIFINVLNYKKTEDAERLEDAINQECNPRYAHLLENKVNIERKINDLISELANQTGHTKLKISHDDIHGFFLIIPKKFANNFINIKEISIISHNDKDIFALHQDLSNFKNEINLINGKIEKSIQSIIEKFMEIIRTNISIIKNVGQEIGKIDLIYSFAKAAKIHNYTKPKIAQDRKISIKEGYHPIYQVITKKNLTTNDIEINNQQSSMIITGANMSGKTTYLKQIGITCFMANIGCFVPCKKMECCLLDQIFSRIGASDDLYKDKSTFFIEMEEMADMLNNATHNSLCLIDEIGRGTGILEGIKISENMLEYLIKKINTFVICSTHIHELIKLAERLPNLKNYHFDFVVQNNQIKFSFKIKEGYSLHSMATEVARMAGVPKEVLQNIENNNNTTYE